jgi:glycosyltransferase involved in cell wall biosynthesis
VTVIISTYNWATVLPYSVGSVVDQTFEDFELLVIGDCCTDESAAVMRRFTDPRVQWHNLERNSGHQATPNNEGLRRARGDVIAYLGHDDVWLPRHLELTVEAVTRGAGVAIASTLLVSIDRQPVRWPGPAWEFEAKRWIPPSAIVHRRELAAQAGGWSDPRDGGHLVAEADFLVRLARVGGEPAYVDRVTSVKLPAGTRRDSYRRRPSHEQAYWLARIRASQDPEAMVRRALREPYIYAVSRPLLERGRDWGRARTRPVLRRLGLAPARPVMFEERWRKARRFKGLPDDID